MKTIDDLVKKRTDSLRRVIPHVATKIVDPSEWSRSLRIGKRGKFVVSGYLLMQGYLNNSARTGEVLVPDWEVVL
ncbi:hypothetical protein GQ43DRAFT_445253 [Delitschia confertaspora ATCC 74209]|uniref:Uncharacterized protein n=1 Tax=Delitschia confertaspora ATCC 74209 TaxID=1513339 RepID=A0A9P4JB59_9PLEO|nr:hypothetical protein GQ43DRAFT_445253 [Delitschia confertaspora ATCC 74209]